MLNPIHKTRYEKRLALIESSFRVEGMDPVHDAVYRDVKDRVLRGEMIPKQALAYVVEETRKLSQPVLISA